MGNGRFRHEALIYSGEDEFLAGVLPYVREGLAADEPILVAVRERSVGLLRLELGDDADRVHFADMANVGRNPARIIPMWREFVGEHGVDGRPVRGVGEPAWSGRSAAELAECRHHEALLNLAFAAAPAWSLLCPYDAKALDAETVAGARCTHPVITEHGVRRSSAAYLDTDAGLGMLNDALSPAASTADTLEFTAGQLGVVRDFVSRHAAEAGLDGDRRFDLVLAVNELASNTVHHGGGRGTLAVWRENGGIVCEVRDAGRIVEPLVGRFRPPPDAPQGRGLWIVNQLCDLVQIRSRGDGSVVRVRMDR